MAETAGGVVGRGPMTLDQLIALNDELVALTRSGMPLERGLVDTGPDLPGRLGKIATDLGKRMGQGENLDQALAGLGDGVPPVYRAVVQAGLRSGRLPVALEGLTAYARGYAESRQAIGLALWYPLLVVTLATALFIFIASTVIPRFLSLFVSLGLPPQSGLVALNRIGENAWYWAPALPIGLALIALAWASSGRALSLQGGRRFGVLRWFPWLGSMMRRFEAAGFADLLALLVEHKVPYPEALALAGEASGDFAIARESRDLAAAIARGEAPADALKGATGWPPMLRWVIATGPQQGELVVALRQMATRYRSEARHLGDKIRVLLPTILLIGIAAVTTLIYALAVFVPLTTLYQAMSGPAR